MIPPHNLIALPTKYTHVWGPDEYRFAYVPYPNPKGEFPTSVTLGTNKFTFEEEEPTTRTCEEDAFYIRHYLRQHMPRGMDPNLPNPSPLYGPYVICELSGDQVTKGPNDSHYRINEGVQPNYITGEGELDSDGLFRMSGRLAGENVEEDPTPTTGAGPEIIW